MSVVGIDPGAKTTGIVVREGEQLLKAELVHSDARTIGPDYLWDVLEAIQAAWALAFEAHGEPLLALEDLTHPSPHLGVTNVAALLDTAQVIGAIRADSMTHRRHLVMVPPGGNGSGPTSGYPAALVGPRERRGTGKLRHVRSAWDIAGAARFTSRVQSPCT